MRIFRGHTRPVPAPVVVAIGNFDGVHLGHAALIARLTDAAERLDCPPAVLTFEPHPREFFTPDSAPARLSTLREKLELLADFGVEQAMVCPFNARFAGLTADAFIEQVLVRGLQVRHLIVGDDFRFGKGRAGDFSQLEAAGVRFGFTVEAMGSVTVDGERVSSSGVRRALAAGDMAHAARLLGRPYIMDGQVLHGQKLGRQLGFATANLRIKHNPLPMSGVFAVEVSGLGDKPLPGVANMGVRPSLDPNDVNGGRVLLETHCLEWPANLGPEGAYGKIIRVELLHKLHDELRYTSLDALTTGIAKDCEDARAFFASAPSLHGQTHRQTTRDRI